MQIEELVHLSADCVWERGEPRRHDPERVVERRRVGQLSHELEERLESAAGPLVHREVKPETAKTGEGKKGVEGRWGGLYMAVMN